MTNPSPEQIAAMFGCTVSQVRAQFAANAKQLAKMAEKAESLGRKVNGYTATELRARAAAAAAKS